MQLLPNVVKTIKDLVELQRGALEVPCPLAFYKRASGQVSAAWQQAPSPKCAATALMLWVPLACRSCLHAGASSHAAATTV